MDRSTLLELVKTLDIERIVIGESVTIFGKIGGENGTDRNF